VSIFQLPYFVKRHANTRPRFTLSPSLSLPRVASHLPFTFTGADLYALCSDAMLKAVTRSARQVDDRVAAVNTERANQGKHAVTIAGFFDHHATPSDLEVQVEEQDFELARKELTPSVSYEELKHYEKVRDQFEGGPKKEKPQQAQIEADVGQEMQAVTTTTTSSSKSQMSESDKKFARDKFNELMARRTSSKNAVPQSNGGGDHGDNGGNSSGDDDDYVIRTDRLTINGSANGNGNGRPSGGKGKGKGKSRENPVVQEVDGEGEDLYD
jgi:peroxin-6